MDSLSAITVLLGVASRVTSFVSTFHDSPRELVNLGTEVVALQEILSRLLRVAKYSNLGDVGSSVGTQKAFEACLETLHSIETTLKDLYKDHRVRRLSKARINIYLRVNADRIRKLKTDLDRHKATFSVLLSGLSMIESSNARSALEDLQERVKQLSDLSLRQLTAYEESVKEAKQQQMKRQLLDDISTYDYRAAHFKAIGEHVERTGEWFLRSDEYLRWEHTPNSSLDVLGSPGSGKTMLCSLVVQEQLKRDKPALAYFYIKYGERITSQKLVRSLVRQIIEQAPSVSNNVYDVFGHGAIFSLDDETLREVFLDVIAVFHEAIVILDALDELEAEERSKTLNLLELGRKNNLKWISFSRPVALAPSSQPYMYHTGEPKDVELIIQSYLKRSSQLVRNPEMLERISQTIQRKAHGQLLWTRLVLERVIRQTSFKNMRRVIDSLPNDLDDYYDSVWRKLDQDGQLLVLAVASSPDGLHIAKSPEFVQTLQPDLISTQVATNSASNEFALKTYGLVTVADNRVQFIHRTVRQWLEHTVLETSSQTRTQALQAVQFGQGAPIDEPEHLDDPNELKALEDDDVYDELDEISSVSSYSSTVFSHSSSRSSQATSSADFLSKTAVEQFSGLFLDHEAFAALIQEFLSIRGQDGFEAVFFQLLRSYSENLKIIATSGVQQIAAILVGDRAIAVAHQVVVMSGYLDSSKVAVHSSSKKEKKNKLLMLDRYLGRVKGARPHEAIGLEPKVSTKGEVETVGGSVSRHEHDTDENREDETHVGNEMEEEVYIDLAKSKSWLTNTSPFKRMMENLERELHKPPELPPIPTGQVHRPVKDVTIYQKWKLSVGKKLLDALPGGEEPLEVGMKRVRWSCFCGRTFYDDYYEILPGSIDEMQKVLDRTYGGFRKSSISAARGWQVLMFPEVLATWMGFMLLLLNRLIGFANLTSTLYMAWYVFLLSLCCSVIGISCLIAWNALKDHSICEQPEAVDSSSHLTIMQSEHQPSQSSTPADLASTVSSQARIISDGSSHGASGGTYTGPVEGESSVSTQKGKGVERSQGPSQGGSHRSNRDLSHPNADKEIPKAELEVDQRRKHGSELQRDQLWALALFENIKGEEIYVHLNALMRATDFTLFQGLRRKYYLVSSRWQRFTQLREVSRIRFVKFDVTDERRADVLKKDVWPPEHDPRIWYYEPYPAADKIPLVGEAALMDAWRDVHHVDRAAYEEFLKTASWSARFIDRLRAAPRLFMQHIRDSLANWSQLELLDDDGLDPALVDIKPWENLPSYQPISDVPPQQLRSKRIIIRYPKKLGDKIEVDFNNNIYPEAWGLEFEESFRVHRLLFFLLLLYAVCSIALLLWGGLTYGITPPNTPAFIIGTLAWGASLFALTITVWFKWAENRRPA